MAEWDLKPNARKETQRMGGRVQLKEHHKRILLAIAYHLGSATEREIAVYTGLPEKLVVQSLNVLDPDYVQSLGAVSGIRRWKLDETAWEKVIAKNNKAAQSDGKDPPSLLAQMAFALLVHNLYPRYAPKAETIRLTEEPPSQWGCEFGAEDAVVKGYFHFTDPRDRTSGVACATSATPKGVRHEKYLGLPHLYYPIELLYQKMRDRA